MIKFIVLIIITILLVSISKNLRKFWITGETTDAFTDFSNEVLKGAKELKNKENNK